MEEKDGNPFCQFAGSAITVERMRAVLTIGLALLIVPVAVPGAQAQINNCGDINIIFRNPDLQPGADGFIRASGQLFAQFQAIGEGADKIATFGFSFGVHTVDFPASTVCQAPNSKLWFSGQQIINYRADTNPDDGFFINLQTALVPDGTYTAAVHAYDKDDNELARFWAKAIVENCTQDTAPGVQRCDSDPAQLKETDKTMPWPIILPGDGQLPEGQVGFTLEFAEELSNLTVTLNGEDITGQLEQWDGRLWDDDLKPGYGPNGLLGDTDATKECNGTLPDVDYVHHCEYLGVAYRWTQRALEDVDVLRVEARDLSGNLARKDIHIGSSVVGGAITQAAAIVTMTAEEVKKIVGPGSGVDFPFQFVNQGGGDGHVNLIAEGPEGWGARWEPVHVVVPPGGTTTGSVIAKPPAGTPPGTYLINASAEYPGEGGLTKKISQQLTVEINPSASSGGASGTGTGSGGAPVDEADEGKDSPGLGILFVMALLGVASIALRRRSGGQI